MSSDKTTKLIADFQPIGRKIEVPPNTTILKAAQTAGINLNAICGGLSSCGSCIIKLQPETQVTPVSVLEREELGNEKLAQGFRLACQTKLLESIVIEIPEESFSASQRTQIEGQNLSFDFEPVISFSDLELPPFSQGDELSIWGQIKQLLTETGMKEFVIDNLTSFQKCGEILNKDKQKIRLIFHQQRLISIITPETPLLGMAVDIGTTKIAGYLIDLCNGQTIAKKGLMNPQIVYGEDVMARITHAMNETQGIQTLQNVLLNSIRQLAEELCKQASQDLKNHYETQHIMELVLVGNTAMHHLFLGLPVKQLGMAPYLPFVSDLLELDLQRCGIDFSEGSKTTFLPNIAGFVGADHVSMLLAAGVNQELKNTLYIDIGTNTEISLLYDQKIISCSTASGPAFEGAHIQDGIRAADGAIEKVKMDDKGIHFQTINQQKPIGICGSGIVDAIAQMLNNNILKPSGIFNLEHPWLASKKELILVPAEKTSHQRNIVITRKDVGEIQLAKAAIRAAIELMLKEAGLTYQDLKKVVIAGAFGSYIDISSAKRIGMFPDFPTQVFTQIGNAAGIGAVQCLLSKEKRKEAVALSKKIKYLELATHADFTAQYTKAMGFISP